MSFRIETGNGWTMYRGDCIDVMQTLGQVDHVICDPPYEKESHTKARRLLKDATRRKGARNAGSVRRIDQPLEISFRAITEDERSLAAEGMAKMAKRWVIAFCQIEAVGKWRTCFELGGLEWVRGGVWIKTNGAPQFTGDRPGQGFESLAIGHCPGKKRWNGGGKHAVWTHSLDQRSESSGRHEHPTQKPIALMLDLVSDFTDPCETILDPFAGSGTTGVACLRLGRRFIGIEKDEKYFELACERLRAEESSQTLASRRAGQTSLLDLLNRESA